jgi:hypothetical protein
LTYQPSGVPLVGRIRFLPGIVSLPEKQKKNCPGAHTAQALRHKQVTPEIKSFIF